MNLPPASTQTLGSARPRGETATHLSGRWLILARVTWVVIAVLTIGLLIASIPGFYASLHVICTGSPAVCRNTGQITPADLRAFQASGGSLDFFAAYLIALVIVFVVVYSTISAVIFWRRSNDRMALFASLTLVTFPAASYHNILLTLPLPWWLLGQFVSLLGNISIFLFFYLFPTGRFVPRWTRWLWVAVIVFWTLNGFFPSLFINTSMAVLGNVAFLGFICSIIGAQIYRYRSVSSAEQRQQTKWVVYGISIGLGCFLLLNTFTFLFSSLTPQGLLADLITSTALCLFLLLFPLSIGIAILRSRLFDIDIIINRTLVYGLLSVCVVGIYVLVVGSLGTLFQASGNLLISLAATGLVALLFQPLRVFLQRGVNRLLYGQRDEPYTVITRLSQRLEVTLAPGAVLSTIVETVALALKLPYVAILLKREDLSETVDRDASASRAVNLAYQSVNQKENIFVPAASVGKLVGEPVVLPLIYQAETIGQMHLSQRAPGEPLTPADRHLLVELARQAGLAAHAVRLTSDLQRSRELLEQRVEERTRELSTLLEISHNVASTIELKPLLSLILEQLQVVAAYNGASIAVLEGEELVIVDNQGTAKEQLMGLRLPLSRLGRVWEIISHQESVIIEDVRDDTSLAQAYRQAVGDLMDTIFAPIQSLMAVPLLLKDRVMGMLLLSSCALHFFTPRHATLALAIANQAAIAIENARLYEQAQELAAIEERQRLARELHDSVSQALYGIALGAHTARTLLDRDPAQVAEPLDYVLSLAEAGLAEMRALIFELRPESLEIEGLVSALSKQSAALHARHDITVHTELSAEPDLPLKIKQELYRIAQEAMHNTVKHAQASSVDLRLCQTSEAVILEICDNGAGFDPMGSFPGHLGLHSMQERVKGLGGLLQIESSPGQGTCVRAQIPGREPL